MQGSYGQCHAPFKLSAIMLNVVRLSVVAPMPFLARPNFSPPIKK